jgi:DNA topoisomerase II
LTTTKSTTNMYLFDKDQKLVKYNTVYEIIDQYYGVRYNAYIKRKENIIATLEKQLVILSNRAKFIHEQIVEPPTLVMRKKKKAEVIDMLKTKNYAVIDGDEEYKYLRSMTIDSVEEENYKRLVKEKEDKEVELEQIKKITIEKMWLSELTELEQAYVKYRNYRTIRQKGVGAKIKKKSKKSKKK